MFVQHFAFNYLDSNIYANGILLFQVPHNSRKFMHMGLIMCTVRTYIYICNEPNNLHLMSFYLPTQYSPYKQYADRLLHLQEFASTNKQTRAQFIFGRFKLIENSFIPN